MYAHPESRSRFPSIYRLLSRSSLRAAAVGLLLLAAGLAGKPAHAVDGVVEINETCAVQTGCFSGDAPGYPITIDGSAGRSYRLTSGLVVPDENTDGIQLNTNGISIDLNGFEIARTGCAASTSDCTPPSGSGIGISGQSSRGSSARNGSVIGMGSYGVYLGQHAVIVDIRARWNRLSGIRGSNASSIQRCTSFQNGTDGISVGLASTVSDSTAHQNDLDGFSVGTGATVSRTASYLNGRHGYNMAAGITFEGNTSWGNSSKGVYVVGGATITGNTIYQNGSDGIDASGGSLVAGNVIRDNASSWGLRLDAGSVYRDNVISDNQFTVNGGINRGGNVCDGTPTCP